MAATTASTIPATTARRRYPIVGPIPALSPPSAHRHKFCGTADGYQGCGIGHSDVAAVGSGVLPDPGVIPQTLGSEELPTASVGAAASQHRNAIVAGVVRVCQR